jgi:hypothetical protein
LPDAVNSYQKAIFSILWKALGGILVHAFYGHLVFLLQVGIFNGHLVFLLQVWDSLWPFGIFIARLVYFMAVWYFVAIFYIFYILPFLVFVPRKGNTAKYVHMVYASLCKFVKAEQRPVLFYKSELLKLLKLAVNNVNPIKKFKSI